jgi:hypothetical protein
MYRTDVLSQKDIAKILARFLVSLTFLLSGCAPLPSSRPESDGGQPGTTKTEEQAQDNLKVKESEPNNVYLFAIAIVASAEQIWTAPGVTLLIDGAGKVLGFVTTTAVSTGAGDIAIPGAVTIVLGSHVSMNFQDLTEGTRNIELTIDANTKVFEVEVDALGRITDSAGNVVLQINGDVQSQTEGKTNLHDSTASHQPPNGWEMPPRDYCGEDLEEYYSLLLLNEVMASFMRPSNLTIVEKSKLFHDYDSILNRSDNILRRLNDNDCYMYKNGGSVFGDYKLGRSKFFKVDGAQSKWIQSHISLDTSTQDALALCRQLVQQWWSLP